MRKTRIPSDFELSEIKRCVRYDPVSGKLYCKEKPRRKSRSIVGREYGQDRKVYGYITVGLNYRRYYAHQIAWYFISGKWPEDMIDHINGIQYDNRKVNLRHVDNRTNCHNKEIYRKGQFVGVSRNRKAWRAMIKVNGIMIHLGTYRKPEEASMRYQSVLKYIQSLPSNTIPAKEHFPSKIGTNSLVKLPSGKNSKTPKP